MEFFIESHLMISSRKMHNAYIEENPLLSSLKFISDCNWFSEMNKKKEFYASGMKKHKGSGQWDVIFYDSAPIRNLQKILKNVDFVLEYVTILKKTKCHPDGQKLL